MRTTNLFVSFRLWDLLRCTRTVALSPCVSCRLNFWGRRAEYRTNDDDATTRGLSMQSITHQSRNTHVNRARTFRFIQYVPESVARAIIVDPYIFALANSRAHNKSIHVPIIYCTPCQRDIAAIIILSL